VFGAVGAAVWHSSVQLACMVEAWLLGRILTVRVVGRALLHRWCLLLAVTCCFLSVSCWCLLLAALCTCRACAAACFLLRAALRLFCAGACCVLPVALFVLVLLLAAVYLLLFVCFALVLLLAAVYLLPFVCFVFVLLLSAVYFLSFVCFVLMRAVCHRLHASCLCCCLLYFYCFVLVPAACHLLHVSCMCTLVPAITTCCPLNMSCLLSLLLSLLPVLAYSFVVLVPVRGQADSNHAGGGVHGDRGCAGRTQEPQDGQA